MTVSGKKARDMISNLINQVSTACYSQDYPEDYWLIEETWNPLSAYTSQEMKFAKQCLFIDMHVSLLRNVHAKLVSAFSYENMTTEL